MNCDNPADADGYSAPPRYPEKVQAQLPALQLLIQMGWEYPTPAQTEKSRAQPVRDEVMRRACAQSGTAAHCVCHPHAGLPRKPHGRPQVTIWGFLFAQNATAGEVCGVTEAPTPLQAIVHAPGDRTEGVARP